MRELIQQIINDPLSALLIIGNLILIESLLSVDNAAVLATMVMDLPKDERKRALKYGIIGAYIFRGLCLLFATYLVGIWWLKGLGGLYLLYLVISWAYKRTKKDAPAADVKKEANGLYKMIVGRVGNLWATVIAVEVMDLAFSIDNVFAAVAFSGNILIILCGVFIGILAMRFVAQGFVRLMERYPFLEVCAYTVIGLLGIKLSLSLYEHFYPDAALTKLLNNHNAEWITSLVTIGIFIVPVITSTLFNIPARKKEAGK